MRRHKCHAHPDQMTDHEDACLKCQIVGLKGQIERRDLIMAELTGGPQVVLGISYPANQLFEDFLRALKFQKAAWGAFVDARIGGQYSNEATYIVPQNVALALQHSWTHVEKSLTDLEESAIGRVISNASNKIAEQVRRDLGIKLKVVKSKMLKEFRDEQARKAAQAEREAKRLAERSLPLLADFAWSTRARRALRDLGVHTTEELLTRTAADIAATRNCGKITQTEIGGKLAAHGLALQKGKE